MTDKDKTEKFNLRREMAIGKTPTDGVIPPIDGAEGVTLSEPTDTVYRKFWEKASARMESGRVRDLTLYLTDEQIRNWIDLLERQLRSREERLSDYYHGTDTSYIIVREYYHGRPESDGQKPFTREPIESALCEGKANERLSELEYEWQKHIPPIDANEVRYDELEIQNERALKTAYAIRHKVETIPLNTPSTSEIQTKYNE